MTPCTNQLIEYLLSCSARRPAASCPAGTPIVPFCLVIGPVNGSNVPALICGLLGGDRGLRRRRHRLAERGHDDEVVGEAAVVEVALPGAVHRGLDVVDVVRAPVVRGGGQPGVRGERRLVGVVAGPLQAGGRRDLAGGRAVLAVAEHVDAGGDEALGGRALRRPGRTRCSSRPPSRWRSGSSSGRPS